MLIHWRVNTALPGFTAVCVDQSMRLHNLITRLRNMYICLARNGKEAFLAPDTSQILYFVGEMLPVDSSKCEHTLMIK